MNRDTGVDTMLLNRSLEVVRSAVRMLTSPGYLIKFKPTVIHI